MYILLSIKLESMKEVVKSVEFIVEQYRSSRYGDGDLLTCNWFWFYFENCEKTKRR